MRVLVMIQSCYHVISDAYMNLSTLENAVQILCKMQCWSSLEKIAYTKIRAEKHPDQIDWERKYHVMKIEEKAPK